MSYIVYLGGLVAAVIAVVGAGVCMLLPALAIYWLATRLGEQYQLVGIGAGILLSVFGGGYIWMASFARFMDWFASICCSLAV